MTILGFIVLVVVLAGGAFYAYKKKDDIKAGRSILPLNSRSGLER